MAKFVKGKSGNPLGRPPRLVEDAQKSVLDQLFDARAEAQAIQAMISAACDGDVAAFKALMDRKYGKVGAPAEQETVTTVLVRYE